MDIEKEIKAIAQDSQLRGRMGKLGLDAQSAQIEAQLEGLWEAVLLLAKHAAARD